MNTDEEAAFEEVDRKQDELHAKWWEIATWLAQQRGDHDPLKLTAQQRIAYAAEVRELVDNWEAAIADSSDDTEALIPKTEVQQRLAEYCEISTALAELIDEIDENFD